MFVFDPLGLICFELYKLKNIKFILTSLLPKSFKSHPLIISQSIYVSLCSYFVTFLLKNKNLDWHWACWKPNCFVCFWSLIKSPHALHFHNHEDPNVMNISVAKQRIDAHNNVFIANSQKIELEMIFILQQKRFQMIWQFLPFQVLPC